MPMRVVRASLKKTARNVVLTCQGQSNKLRGNPCVPARCGSLQEITVNVTAEFASKTTVNNTGNDASQAMTERTKSQKMYPSQSTTTTFTVEIAGVPAEIRSRFSENVAFFQDYFSDKTPRIMVAPTDDYLEWIQEDFDRMNEARGWPICRLGDSYLELNAIHAVLAENLLDYGTLLIHGSALCIDGQAVIFVAPSGTGKSTHARLWRETFGDRVWMINDDKPMIRMIDGKAFVYGTPWNGKHHLSTNACAPLKAIVKLTRDKTNHIEPMKPVDAYTTLVSRAFFSRDPAIMSKILELEHHLLDTVRHYLLGCNMLPEAAIVSYEGIFAASSSEDSVRRN